MHSAVGMSDYMMTWRRNVDSHVTSMSWARVCVRVCVCVGVCVCDVRSILFDQDGIRLFAGAHNVLKVFSWPLATCLESLPVSWASVADLALTHTYLVR